MPTIGEALQYARQRLRKPDGTEMIEARTLLSAIVDKSSAWILAHLDEPLRAEQTAQFTVAVEKCATGYPIAYFIGKRGFYHWDFIVTPDVLIPRPETELLVEYAFLWASERFPQGRGMRMVDIGTGSGVIAVCMALLLPQANVMATDISPTAIRVAEENALYLNTTVIFAQGDLTDALPPGHTFDLITANLPYIATAELPGLEVAKWEPRVALDGGRDGLELIRRLLDHSRFYLSPGGMMLLEIGENQGSDVYQMARVAFPTADVHILTDLAGFDRLIAIKDQKIA